MACNAPVDLRKTLGFMVACGRCHACRLARTKEWASRLYFEKAEWGESSFITLTYDNDHLPLYGGLVKKDLQNFFKRFRKDYGKPIKYFACGEYGDLFGRPHYHAVLFGYGLRNSDQDQYDEYLKKLWLNQGLVKALPAAIETMMYVSGYIQKKLFKVAAEETYGDLQPPFQLQSKGLGLSFIERPIVRKQLLENKKLTIDGKPIHIPRYFRKKLDNEELDNYLSKKARDLQYEDDMRILKSYSHEFLESKPVLEELRKMDNFLDSLPLKHNYTYNQIQDIIRAREEIQRVRELKLVIRDEFKESSRHAK